MSILPKFDEKNANPTKADRAISHLKSYDEAYKLYNKIISLNDEFNKERADIINSVNGRLKSSLSLDDSYENKLTALLLYYFEKVKDYGVYNKD